MKKFIFILLIIIGLTLIVPYSYCQDNESSMSFDLSLTEAITLAFKNNKDIQIQEEEIVIAKANIGGARSQFLPKLNLNAGYNHNAAVTKVSPQGSKKDPGIFTGYENDNRLGVSLDESIFNGGANIANLEQAQLGLKVQQESLRARKLDVEFETKRLYYGLLLAYETERIAQNLLSQAQSHYADAENKFSQGTASKFDMLQSKVQVSKVMPELIKAKNAADLIAAQLKKLLGIKMRETIRLKDRLEYSLVTIDESEFLKQAYLNKPEMILKSLGVDISKWSIQMAKAAWRPQINAEAGYSYRSDNVANMFIERHNNWNAGVSVTIPLFDGFASKAKVDAAQVRYAQANLEKEDLIDQIAVDVRRACLDLNQAKAIIDSSQDNIAEAKEALKIAGVSFDNGEGTNLEILDAQVSLSQIEENYSSAIYDYLMAKAFLDRTTGLNYLEEAKNEKKD